jgi:hypothetical protein
LQLVNVASEILYEGVCLDIRTGWYKELIGDNQWYSVELIDETQALAVDEHFFGVIPVGSAYNK